VAAAGVVHPAPRLGAAICLRAGLPVVLALSLSAALVAIGGEPLTDPADARLTLPNYLAGLVLAAPANGAGSLLGLGWVLTVGAMFWLLWVGTAAMSRVAWLVPVVQLAALAAVVFTAAAASAGWYQRVGMFAVFATLPVFGQMLWLNRAQRMSVWSTGILALGCLVLLVHAEREFPALAGWSYPLTAVYAAVLSVLALVTRSKARHRGLTQWLSSRSYSLFLMIGVLGYATLGALAALIPLAPALLTALVVTGLGTELSYRLVELPGRRLLRSAGNVPTEEPRR
jgi:peptidoglycan/LPS O-acetylase OafA/YrhL